MISQENEDLTFQPILVKSPFASRYTSTSPGHTMSSEGVLDNLSVFERLSLAAQQKLQNEERARELAKKGTIYLFTNFILISLFLEFPFQPVLTTRAKSVPKRYKKYQSIIFICFIDHILIFINRRKPEEISVPIYDRLIQAGVRYNNNNNFH